jgi:hypothetical protein
MSISYASSIDALHDLFSSHCVTGISANLSELKNGVEYVFVEITCDDGSQYGLQAYGKEALELHRVALEIAIKPIPPMVVP